MNICGYCAQQMQGTPGDAAITQHIENCAKHPVTRLRLALEKIREPQLAENGDILTDALALDKIDTIAREALEGR